MATVKLDPAKGVQIPNMTTTERNAISSPETGALIWNTTTSAINQYNGSAWSAVDTSTDNTKLPLAGGAMTGNLNMGANEIILADNGIIEIGTGTDLKIYHDGSHSYIKEAGTGSLKLLSSQFEVLNNNGTTDMIRGVESGAVTLYHNNASKLATSALGVTVTGGVSLGGTGTANTLDDYEEGTWTPTLSGGTSGQDLHYTKIGNVVHIAGSISFSSISGSGIMIIGGLPFTSKSMTEGYLSLNAHAYIALNISSTTGNYQTLRVDSQSTNLKIIAPTGAGSYRVFGNYSHVSGGTFVFRVGGSYLAA
jgi:hypothetical protein